jgi:hypothetical protein
MFNSHCNGKGSGKTTGKAIPVRQETAMPEEWKKNDGDKCARWSERPKRC